MKADTISIAYRAKTKDKTVIHKNIVLRYIHEGTGVIVHQITLSTN